MNSSPITVALVWITGRNRSGGDGRSVERWTTQGNAIVRLSFSGFRPEVVDKVIRLLLVLDRIGAAGMIFSSTTPLVRVRRRGRIRRRRPAATCFSHGTRDPFVDQFAL